MQGKLIINVYADNVSQPVENAYVTVSGENYHKEFTTDASGKVFIEDLPAPDKKYSMNYQEDVRPYSTYDVNVKKPGLKSITISNVEIFADEISIQNIYMSSSLQKMNYEDVIILPQHGLWDKVSPKIPEEEIKLENNDLIRVLPNVFIPEYITVHDGVPTNTSSANYTVSFPDYIKNVASGEIYSTWPKETITANVYAIISFTLNRIFTEWYTSKGYNFTITGSPQYDQTYTHNRTIFKSIADIVDEIFTDYIKLNGMTQPFLAQYNDGIKTNNSGWLSQWGSKDLGDKGYTALNILKHYYTNNLTIETANEVKGLPFSFPGYNLKLGSCSEAVQKMQNELNIINGNYPGIPKIVPSDGKFESNMETTVKTFQKVFDLSETGIIDFTTWYKISYIFVAVSKMLQGITG